MSIPQSPVRRGKGILGEPESEKTFQTPYGAFTLRRPSIATQIEIHKQVARELEGLLNIDSMGEMWLLWVSTISVCARAAGQKPTDHPSGFPEDFDWKTSYDAEWLPQLFEDFNKWVQSFRKPQESDADQKGSVGGSTEQAVPNQDEVQPDADRSPVSVANSD